MAYYIIAHYISYYITCPTAYYTTYHIPRRNPYLYPASTLQQLPQLQHPHPTDILTCLLHLHLFRLFLGPFLNVFLLLPLVWLCFRRQRAPPFTFGWRLYRFRFFTRGKHVCNVQGLGEGVAVVYLAGGTEGCTVVLLLPRRRTGGEDSVGAWSTFRIRSMHRTERCSREIRGRVRLWWDLVTAIIHTTFTVRSMATPPSSHSVPLLA